MHSKDLNLHWFLMYFSLFIIDFFHCNFKIIDGWALEKPLKFDQFDTIGD